MTKVKLNTRCYQVCLSAWE